MEYTGERYVPQLMGQMRYEHFHRYAVSLEFVKGKSVLDLASGEGYGSALMAKVAKAVTGVDIDAHAVQFATEQYASLQNLRFLVGSCDSVPVPNAAVDVVTSFETIEHHDKHEEMMSEIKRVLQPDGLLILSSPNREVYSADPDVVRPFHVKELDLNDLITLLGRYFKSVQIYGHRLAIGSYVFPLQGSADTEFVSYVGRGGAVERRVEALNAPPYFMAVCSDAAESSKPGSLTSVYFDCDDDMLTTINMDLAQARTELQESKDLIASMRYRKLRQLRRQVVRLRDTFSNYRSNV